ncbi:MAG: nicotinamide-nucleotide amidohydrolase family protein [Acidobacteriota bacterium]
MTTAAAFIAVGSELLRTQRTDTNSLLAARLLRGRGFRLVEKRCVEDDEVAIGEAISGLVPRVGLIIVCGGLGPTADDVTREGVARALGLAVHRYPPLEEALAARYRALGREVPPFALKMADVIEGAEILPNPRGTAPGQLLVSGETTIVLLPGVPVEFETIFTRHLLPRWPMEDGAVRVLRLAGVYESQVEARVAPLYERFGREHVTILAGRGLVDLVLEVSGEGAARRIREMEEAFAAAAGADLYGIDDATLAGALLAALRQRRWRLAVAESCTGGMVGARLTAEAGASEVFIGGAVAYSNALKIDILGVEPRLLEEHGAVSQPVAEAMADGALRLGAECAVAVTGIAGPGGGSEAKPVGTVHLAAVTPTARRHRAFTFPGDRAAVREWATTMALDLLRRCVVEG